MKKLVSFAIILCMLISAVLPLSVSATTTATDNKSLWNTDSNLGLNAYTKGETDTINVDGVMGDSEAWKNALPLTVNSYTTQFINDFNASNYASEFYMLWDTTNLYILEIKDTAVSSKKYTDLGTGFLGPWSGHTASTMYCICTPDNKTYSGNTITANGIDISTITYGTDSDGDTVVTDGTKSYDSVVRIRSRYHTSSSATTKGNLGVGNVESQFSVNNGKITIETRIPWASILLTNRTEAQVGLKIFRDGSGYLSGGTVDYTGFAPMKLVSGSATVNTKISPDIAYWTDATKGIFNTIDADGVYEISTAEELLGLSYALESNSNDYAWTDGKTFVLTEDINLNPGVTDLSVYQNAANVTEYTNFNVWMSLDNFYGVFDGQGHTVSGIFYPGRYNTTQATGDNIADWGIFGGRANRGATVKNVVLDNSYVASGTAVVDFGGIFGAYRNSAGTDDATTLDDGVLLSNIYVGKGFTVDASQMNNSSKGAGGLIGNGWNDTYTNPSNLDVTFRDIVFAGHFEASANAIYDRVLLGIKRTNSSTSYNYNVTFTDCVITGTYSDDVNATDPDFSGATTTRCGNYGNDATQSIPEGCKGRWITTDSGVMPLVVADMLSKYYYQATVADGDGYYNVRLLGEIASEDYKSVGFEVKIVIIDEANGDKYQKFANTDNTVVYKSVLAAGQNKGTDDLNDGFMETDESAIYVLTLNGLDKTASYRIELSTVWTLNDGTVIKSGAVKCRTPTAWVNG